MSKYIIIDEEAIQKRIEELQKDYSEKDKANDDQWCSVICGKIVALKQILSQSTPLIPEIEKAFYTGKNSYLKSRYLDGSPSFEDQNQEYISNLKLDI